MKKSFLNVTKNWQNSKELSSQNLSEKGNLHICLTRGPWALVFSPRTVGKRNESPSLPKWVSKGRPSAHQAGTLRVHSQWKNEPEGIHCTLHSARGMQANSLQGWTKESFPLICSTSANIWMVQTPSIYECSLKWPPTGNASWQKNKNKNTWILSKGFLPPRSPSIPKTNFLRDMSSFQ